MMDSGLVKQAIDVEQPPCENGERDKVPQCHHASSNGGNINIDNTVSCGDELLELGSVHNHNSNTNADGSSHLARDSTYDNFLKAAAMPIITDHFSLKSSSSRVQFRAGNVYIHNQGDSQYILEEHAAENDDTTSTPRNSDQRYITVKRANTSSLGETLVRATYTAIAVFVGANIFIFSMGLLLFLFSHLAVQMQDVDASKIYDFCGTFLALPILVDGLTHLLVLTSGFVMDVYSGHSLLRLFGWDSVVIGWTTFMAFAGVPLAALIGSLMVQSERIVEITLVSSFVSVVVFFIVFATIVCLQLVKSSLDLVQEFQGGSTDLSLLVKIKRAIWITARSRLSGKQQNLYVYECDSVDGEKELPPQSNHQSRVYMSHGKLWLRLSQHSITNCLFEKLECPQRRLTRSELSGTLLFLTKDNWGLERVFCRNREQSSVVLVGGIAAMTKGQTRSSSVFFFMSNIIYVLLLAAILTWYDTPLIVTMAAIVIFVAYRVYKMRGSAKLAKKVNDTMNHYQDSGECKMKDGEGKGLTHQWKCHTITRPKDFFISSFLLLHLLLCFVFPFTFLCWSRNGSGAVTFIVMSLLHFQLTIMDSEQIVEEIGADVFMKDNPDMENKLKWKYKSRLYHITSMNGYRSIWSHILCKCGTISCSMHLLSSLICPF